MGATYTKVYGRGEHGLPADIPEEIVSQLKRGDIPLGKIITAAGKRFAVAVMSDAEGRPDSKFGQFIKIGKLVYYLKPVDILGGAGRSRNARVKAQPVLYPEEGLHSKWSAPRKRSEKISVDGNAPVNFLTENIDAN
jgi:hypothetical protein